MKYGINNVASAFGLITEEERLPYTVARTWREQRQVKDIIQRNIGPWFHRAMEFGCGYARMTPCLLDFAPEVYARERDDELFTIAQKLWGNSIKLEHVHSLADKWIGPQMDLVMTFTVLQHIKMDLNAVVDNIRSIVKPEGWVLLCEDTSTVDDAYTKGRTVREYHDMFFDYDLVHEDPRYTEGNLMGTYMLFRKRP